VVKLYLILVYDISVERVNKVRNYLKQYLNWVQNSAFEGDVTEGEFQKIKIGLKRIIKEEEDSILFYKASSKKWVDKEAMGVEKSEPSIIV